MMAMHVVKLNIAIIFMIASILKGHADKPERHIDPLIAARQACPCSQQAWAKAAGMQQPHPVDYQADYALSNP